MSIVSCLLCFCLIGYWVFGWKIGRCVDGKGSTVSSVETAGCYAYMFVGNGTSKQCSAPMRLYMGIIVNLTVALYIISLFV